MRGNFKFTILVIAILCTFFILARELIKTKSQLKKSQDQIAQQHIEKLELQDELKYAQDILCKTSRDLRNAKTKLDFVNKKIKVAKKNNTELRQAKLQLEQRVALLEQEKQVMEARLHSLKELKNAICELKAEIRQQKIDRQEKIDAQELAQGNRGFLIKEGKALCQPKIKIEVRPAS